MKALLAYSILQEWEVLGLTLAAALLPATAVFIWAVFFRKRGVRRIRKRRRIYRPANSAIVHTNGNGAPPTLKREETTAEPRF